MVSEAAAPCQRGWLDPWQQAARRTSPAGAWAASGHRGAGCHDVGLQAVLHRVAGRAARGCGPAGAWATSRRGVGSGCSGAAPGARRRQTGRVARSPGSGVRALTTGLDAIPSVHATCMPRACQAHDTRMPRTHLPQFVNLLHLCSVGCHVLRHKLLDGRRQRHTQGGPPSESERCARCWCTQRQR